MVVKVPGLGLVARVVLWLALAVSLILGGCAGGGGNHPAAVHQVVAVVPGRPQPTVAATVPGPVHYRDRVVVLMFHNLGSDPQGDTVAPATFAADLAALRTGGFSAVSAAQFAAFLNGRGTVPPNAYLLTFDDGYEGVYQYAYPLLLQYRDPALLFPVAGWVGQRPDRLTWPQLRIMLGSGLVAVGSHTYDSHGALPVSPVATVPATVATAYSPLTGRTETVAQAQARMFGDLSLAEAAIRAHLGVLTPYFAYPFGAYDQPLIQVLHRVGYRDLFSTLGGANAPGENPDVIFRINVGTPRVTPAGLVEAVSGTGRGPVYRAPSFWCQPWCAKALAGELGGTAAGVKAGTLK